MVNEVHEPHEKKSRKINTATISIMLLKMRTFITLILLIVVFGLIAPNFTNPSSLILIAKHVALYGILAIGMTFVIITAGIDLTVGSLVGLAAMISGGLLYEGFKLPMFGINIYFSVPIIIGITLIIGMLIGALNGLIITKYKLAPFIVTLGMLYIVRGVAMLRSNGATFPDLSGKPELGNTGFNVLGDGTILNIPVAIWIMVVIALLATFILKKLPLGWHVYAVGGNEKAALMSGIKVKSVKMFVYIFSGFCAAMVGLIVASQLSAAQPASGQGWEMNAIAATVLGGTSMAGGSGSIGGTIVGAFVIGVLSDGMVMCGVSEFWQQVIMGVVIIIAVIFDQIQKKFQSKLALQAIAK